MIGLQYTVNLKDGKSAEALEIVHREKAMATGAKGFCRDLLIWQRMTGSCDQLLLTYVVDSLSAWEQLKLTEEFRALIDEGWQYMDRQIELSIVRIVE